MNCHEFPERTIADNLLEKNALDVLAIRRSQLKALISSFCSPAQLECSDWQQLPAEVGLAHQDLTTHYAEHLPSCIKEAQNLPADANMPPETRMHQAEAFADQDVSIALAQIRQERLESQRADGFVQKVRPTTGEQRPIRS